MPVCPNCKEEYRTRSKGRCPGCGVRVVLYEGHWFLRKGSPTENILKYFYRRISDIHSDGRKVAVMVPPPAKGMRYKREMVVAHRLLKKADMDYELVIEAIDLLFNHKRFSWKSRDSLLWIENDFHITLAIAKSIRKEKEERRKREQQVYGEVMKREDIFS